MILQNDINIAHGAWNFSNIILVDTVKKITLNILQIKTYGIEKIEKINLCLSFLLHFFMTLNEKKCLRRDNGKMDTSRLFWAKKFERVVQKLY